MEVAVAVPVAIAVVLAQVVMLAFLFANKECVITFLLRPLGLDS